MIQPATPYFATQFQETSLVKGIADIGWGTIFRYHGSALVLNFTVCNIIERRDALSPPDRMSEGSGDKPADRHYFGRRGIAPS
jgi:hypothetical protein